tara:strand:+ start:467 stop:973 length:507 start_codon:yes stop_codon:yes gene_type:complete
VLRQDYILREIERTVEFCLRAAGFKKPDIISDLQQFLEEHCEQLTGIPLQTLLETEAQKLVALLYHPGTARLPQLISSGAWLCEAADLSLLAGRQSEARRLFHEGVQILAFIASQHGEDDGFSLLREHLETLQRRLPDYHFGTDETRRIHDLLIAGSPPEPDRPVSPS